MTELETVTIHTIKCGDFGDESKPILVLCHGLNQSGAIFFKMMKQLVSRFRLLTIDIPGMGVSSQVFDADIATISA